MIFAETKIDGVLIVATEPSKDDRGLFVRTYSREEFVGKGLMESVVVASASFNERAGTLRGLHYQAKPHWESKLVRCSRGAVFDVAIDLRSDSDTYCEWHGEVLTADNRVALYIPRGCAHGFVTLEDSTELVYMMDENYYPELARGVRWDDPAFGIDWPLEPRVISERDALYEDFAG